MVFHTISGRHLIKLCQYVVCVCLCVLACVSVLSLKGHSCLEARCSALLARHFNGRADALPTAFCDLHHSFHHLLTPSSSVSFTSPPPPVSCSLYLISLSQAVRSECCLLCTNPSAYSLSVLGCGFSPHCLQSPNAIWAIKIQRSQCRATIRACLIQWGQPSDFLS